MDEKPKQGERKMADDALSIVNELLKEVEGTMLLRRVLLEYGLEQSEYNFDFMLELLKIYDECGCSIAFNQMMIKLTQKGVQHESMGFL